MPRRSSPGPPETFSPPFSPLYPRIHGLFPAIEFAVAFSPSLPNPGDPRATLARVCLNSGDLTAAERSNANVEIHYHPGKANVVVDALSRKSQVNILAAHPMPYELAKEFDKLSLGFLYNIQGDNRVGTHFKARHQERSEG
jgi:hypothetical protein